MTKLGDVLKLALGERVVDGDGGFGDEASERGPVVAVEAAPKRNMCDGNSVGSTAATWSGPRINTDEQAVAWRRIVDFVHAKGALIVARSATSGTHSGAPAGAPSGH